MAALKYWVWLSELRLRLTSALSLVEEFGSPEAVFFAREEEYGEFNWLSPKERRALSDKSMERALEITDLCREEGIRLITVSDAEYPSRLKNIYDPPVVLYVKGTLPEIDEEAAVGIVGTRKCTPYGIRSAERISYEIAKGGGLVVTGLARGIDSAAARGALRAGGKVLGVLGCGIDVVYPPENKALFEDVLKEGALVSEYPPKTEPHGSFFPARNRIMSGLSAGVLIIEAPERSGALITAARALEQGRDVFAVPGNIDAESCKGSNGLLKEGAEPVTAGWDILSHYVSQYPGKLSKEPFPKEAEIPEDNTRFNTENVKSDDAAKVPAAKKEIDNAGVIEYIDLMDEDDGMSNDEKAVFRAIGKDERFVDEIAEKSGLGMSKVLSALTMLQIKGYVVQKQGKRFVVGKKKKQG